MAPRLRTSSEEVSGATPLALRKKVNLELAQSLTRSKARRKLARANGAEGLAENDLDVSLTGSPECWWPPSKTRW